MKGAVLILVPGILTWPGDAKNWNKRGVTHINTIYYERGFCADTCEYFCGPVGRAVWQRRREERLAHLIEWYLRCGFTVDIGAHSNGGDVSIGALQRLNWPRIRSMHLFSAATEADFRHNGLNRAIERRRIGDVYIYVGGRDVWLEIARWPIGELLGYDGQWHWDNLFSLKGALGYAGPRNVSIAAAPAVHTHREPKFGHSDWWVRRNFSVSMKQMALPDFRGPHYEIVRVNDLG